MVQVRITFLWNFCHLFPVLYYEWNTSIDDNLFFFFLEIISWKGTLLFNGGFIFKWEVPHMGHQFWRWGGGGNPHAHLSLWETLDKVFWKYALSLQNRAKYWQKRALHYGHFFKTKGTKNFTTPFNLVICIKIKLCIIFIKGGRISLSDALKV